MKQALQDHIHPKHSEIVQRYQKKNHLHFGQEHESVSNLVSQLRSLSTDRNFANTLERMLRDRLVCRINNYRIQRRLLAEKDLTFVKALDIATALELAEKSAADLHDSTSKGTRNVSGTSEGDVNFIKQRKSFKDTECWFCHSKSHVQRFCKLRRDQSRPENRNRNVNVNKIPSMSAILKMTRTQKLKCTLCSGHRAKRNLIQCR